MRRFLSIDIGGTSAKTALVDSGGGLTPLGAFPTGSAMTRAELCSALTNVLSHLPSPPDGIGISTVGAVNSASGVIEGAVENLPCVEGFRPADVFSRALPGIPLSVMNDVSAAAVGEHWLGAGRDCRDFICVAFGTGVGSCIVLNGCPLDGVHHHAGEIGYWDYEAPDRYWELTGSAQALFSRARRETGDRTLDGIRFFERLQLDDPVCTRLFGEWCSSAGRVLSNLVLILDVERIIIGGGISAQGTRLTEPLQRATDRFLPPDFRCPIVPAKLGNHAALLGAVRPLI